MTLVQCCFKVRMGRAAAYPRVEGPGRAEAGGERGWGCGDGAPVAAATAKAHVQRLGWSSHQGQDHLILDFATKYIRTS